MIGVILGGSFIVIWLIWLYSTSPGKVDWELEVVKLKIKLSVEKEYIRWLENKSGLTREAYEQDKFRWHFKGSLE